MIKKIIVVGGGRWGTNHIRTLIDLNSLYAVVEPCKETQNKLKKKFPDIILYNNLMESFDSKPDGYIVSTPSETHFKVGREIIENKFPLLIEKPLTLDYNTSKEIVDLAKRNNVNLMVGHVLLFHPAIIKIKELIDNNVIGNLKYLYSNRLNLGVVRNKEDVFWSLASHDLSVFEYLIDLGIIEYKISNQSFLQRNINDIAIANLKYENNIQAHIFTSWVNPFKEHKWVVIGSKGMVVFEDSSIDKNILLYRDYYKHEADNSVKIIKKEAEIIDYDRTSTPLGNELNYFIKNIDKEFIISNGKLGSEVVKILEKIQN